MDDSTDRYLAQLETRFAALLLEPLCQKLRAVIGQRVGHLVGGALRDTALGQPIRDLDVVVSGGGEEVAASLAARLGSRSIKVGGHRFAAYRVMAGALPVDIWDRGTLSIAADLRRRDFTIHAFALDLRTGALTDPFSGVRDLMVGQLRLTSVDSFVDDPLRVLRLCRFAAQLGEFRVETDTLTRARKSAPALVGVASERIQTEIELTLGQARTAVAVELWIELRVLPEALLNHRLDPLARRNLQAALSSSYRALEQTGAALPVPSDQKSAQLALLLSLLGDAAGLGSPPAVIDTLRQQGHVTTSRYRRVSRLLEAGHLPAAESQQRWYLHRLGELWPEAVSLSAALASQDTDEEQDTARLTQAVELATGSSGEIFNPPALISGDDLQSRLAIEPGPRLGRILAIIRRRQIEGTITTPAAALAHAKRLCEASGPESGDPSPICRP